MPNTREVTFELERFEWTGDDRLEVVGRWHGLAGRRLARPVLSVDVGGRRHRLNAVPGGHMPKATGERWKAAFVWPQGRVDIEAAELEIGRSLVVELPPPRRRKRKAGAAAAGVDEQLHAELAELRAQIAELRRTLPESSEAEALADSAEAVAETAEGAAAETADAAPPEMLVAEDRDEPAGAVGLRTGRSTMGTTAAGLAPLASGPSSSASSASPQGGLQTPLTA